MVIRKIAPTGKWAKANPRQVRNSEQKRKKKKRNAGSCSSRCSFWPITSKDDVVMWFTRNLLFHNHNHPV